MKTMKTKALGLRLKHLLPAIHARLVLDVLAPIPHVAEIFVLQTQTAQTLSQLSL